MHNQAIYDKYKSLSYPKFMTISSFGYTLFLCKNDSKNKFYKILVYFGN